jgi:iron only hydrogenase large subunit-like protein
MSAILSADDLNDFISPGVACIKPIETLPAKPDELSSNEYEVTTEDKVAAQQNAAAPAQISLTDCLACSGCVTSAEAVLVSLQSHVEVLSTLEKFRSLSPSWTHTNGENGVHEEVEGKIFIASISPQVRASLAAVYQCSEAQAGHMIQQLLCGPSGLASGGAHNSRFLWTIDTNTLRDAALVLAAEEMVDTLENDNDSKSSVKKPILTSACPGWICYAEKTHPHILPHLSRLKSPQALAGTLLKSVLAKEVGVRPEQVWHLAVMPCFDKKLEASRSELTSALWDDTNTNISSSMNTEAVRDVDCVITARELISLAEARGLDFGAMPRTPLPRRERVRFPDPTLDGFLFPSPRRRAHLQKDAAAGSSGGYLWHILQRTRARNPGSRIKIERGRNADVVEYAVVRHNDVTGREEAIFKAARYYGFRNIQNLVRRLKPKGTSKLLAAVAARGGGARKPGAANGLGAAGVGSEYAYVEVMACPGGCTNGGGQVRVGEVEKIRGGGEQMDVDRDEGAVKSGPAEQRAWLAGVDEAYFSASSPEVSGDESDGELEVNGHSNGYTNGHTNCYTNAPSHGMDVDSEDEADVVDGISRHSILTVLNHWSAITGVERDKLVFTTYREVESDVGKEKKGKKVSDVDRVAGLASSIGGGW